MSATTKIALGTLPESSTTLTGLTQGLLSDRPFYRCLYLVYGSRNRKKEQYLPP